MATEFLMPKLGLTMEEGTIAEWLVADGQPVEAGTAVLRIETDKTETDVEAGTSGRLHAVGAVGETFACGELIGWLLADGEAVPGRAPPAANGERVLASPNARRIAAERGLDLRTVRGTGPGGRIVSEDLDGAPPAAPESSPPPGGRIVSEDVNSAPPAAAESSPPIRTVSSVPATAAARQLADLLGVDLAAVPADPVDGRVTREAVAVHVRERLAGGRAAQDTAAPLAQEPAETLPLTGMRGTIAKRMHESLQQMAQLTLFVDADLDAVLADRTARAAAGREPSYTDYVIAAVARALARHPRVNAQVTADGVAVLPDAHVGMAVALDEGLVVPVVRNTARHDLTSLSAETARLAGAARDGSLEYAEVEGGTFSVSTLGMFGVDGFTPVINPPNAAILGVGRLRHDVVLDGDGAVSTVARATLSLTWDHRAFDGAPAAEFARTVCDLLRDPAELDRTAPAP